MTVDEYEKDIPINYIANVAQAQFFNIFAEEVALYNSNPRLF